MAVEGLLMVAQQPVERAPIAALRERNLQRQSRSGRRG
jgi:hypothetical protein